MSSVVPEGGKQKNSANFATFSGGSAFKEILSMAKTSGKNIHLLKLGMNLPQ